ncbi:21.1 kDa [Spodoptera frugiperda ascovirus 1a]|uniref:21.1 kDa n=1 Tax=Spodoptera frugiperda ascovirus 1a TaxID=113370 RepID=Q0E562_SFAVA|nr:21.1 kDa [Spodoptera frugiperda ascovirus 1a]CAL44639.1 21.1 kDa [Spodoptera frugiperda ascovirus 1a]
MKMVQAQCSATKLSMLIVCIIIMITTTLPDHGCMGFDVKSTIVAALDPVTSLINRVKSSIEDVKTEVNTVIEDVKSLKNDAINKVSEVVSTTKSMAVEIKQFTNLTTFIHKLRNVITKQDILDLETGVINFILDLSVHLAVTVHKRWPMLVYAAAACTALVATIIIILTISICVLSCRLRRFDDAIKDTVE